MAKYVAPCVDFVLEGVEDDVITRRLRQAIPVTGLNTVTQLCTLLDAMLTEDKGITDPQVRPAGRRPPPHSAAPIHQASCGGIADRMNCPLASSQTSRTWRTRGEC